MRLLIVGAGGFGREVYAYARDARWEYHTGTPFSHVAFLDDNPDALDGFGLDTEVVGTIDDGPIGPDDRVIIAVGDPRIRHALAQRVEARGARFASIVHPRAWIAPTATIGHGVVIAPFSFVGPAATVGDQVALNTYASAGHDATIGRYGVLSPYAVVNGNVRLGEGVFLGTHATVVVGKQVGEWSKLAAGTVVFRDVEPCTLCTGNPGRGRVMFTPPEPPVVTA